VFSQQVDARRLASQAEGDHPSYGISLIEDADFCRRIRTDTAAVLKIENV
jgi:malate dehydrogenase (quinone)